MAPVALTTAPAGWLFMGPDPIDGTWRSPYGVLVRGSIDDTPWQFADVMPPAPPPGAIVRQPVWVPPTPIGDRELGFTGPLPLPTSGGFLPDTLTSLLIPSGTDKMEITNAGVPLADSGTVQATERASENGSRVTERVQAAADTPAPLDAARVSDTKTLDNDNSGTHTLLWVAICVAVLILGAYLYRRSSR